MTYFFNSYSLSMILIIKLIWSFLIVSLTKKDKSNLNSCLKKSNCLVILTTGRAGTDFLQSCYDSHPEVASTCEKSTDIFNFIRVVLF